MLPIRALAKHDFPRMSTEWGRRITFNEHS
jgi:hypothetical protein